MTGAGPATDRRSTSQPAPQANRRSPAQPPATGDVTASYGSADTARIVTEALVDP